MDTIYAASTGAPPAAIAIIRLSGGAARASAMALAGSLPADRVAGLRALRDPRDGCLLDRALVLVFPGPLTATGEDVVELHVHGGRAVVAATEGALGALPGMRKAEPGEFTRRALLNGVIDLTEAEGLADLLTAETESQRRAALRVAEGGVRVLVERWTAELLAVTAEVEAHLDFSDEGDVGEFSITSAGRITAIADAIGMILAQPPVERLRDGIRVVLAGPPNSGKSTLLNTLAEREAAIVSPMAGTTRDRIEAPVVRDGIAYLLTDTAGLAEATSDPIEQVGIGLARAAMATADIVLWLGNTSPPDVRADVIRVHAQCDRSERRELAPGTRLAVSALTGEGVSALWTAIAQRSDRLLPPESEVATNQRQRTLLQQCRGHLAGAANEGTGDLLIVAEELRLARRALDMLTGRAGTEAVLDTLFARFCIGK